MPNQLMGTRDLKAALIEAKQAYEAACQEAGYKSRAARRAYADLMRIQGELRRADRRLR